MYIHSYTCSPEGSGSSCRRPGRLYVALFSKMLLEIRLNKGTEAYNEGLPVAVDLPDRGPLATVSLTPVVRRAAEPVHRTAFRQQEMREKRWENARRDRERKGSLTGGP